MALDMIMTFLDVIFGILVIFITIIIFDPINKTKKFKVKEDQLFLQKTLITNIFICLFLLLNIITFFSDNPKKYCYIISNFLFNVYIIMLILYNFMMTLEFYNTYKNPVHYFNSFFHQNKYNYLQEFIIIIASVVTLILDLILKYNKIDEETEKNRDKIFMSFLILMPEWKPFVIIIISIINLVLFGKIKSQINSFYFNKSKKVIKIIQKKIMNYLLYLTYGIFHIFPLITKILNQDDFDLEFFNFFGSIFFFIVIVDDYIIFISEIATTKFCEYSLRTSLLGYFCTWFYVPKRKKASIGFNSNNSKNDLTSFQTDLTSSCSSLISNNIYDKELVSIYKNKIFFEDYFMGYFDQILNIITSSLYQVYNSKYFSTQANEQNLTKKLKIPDISAIGGNMKDTSVSAIGTKTAVNAKNEVGEDTVKFTMIKNNEKDDLKRFQEILENRLLIKNKNNFLNVSINSFLTPRCVESIYDQKIKGRNIGNSLLSHMILSNVSKNRNPESPNSTFWSLLASNSKEPQFNKMKNMSIKTYDKFFTLDIFDTDDDELNFSNPLYQLLDKYFTYIHGKGINGTFIPSLLGVFKIKINNFKTLLVFVTRNSLVENVPKSHFSYWQLLRIIKGKPEKVSSSQFNSTNLFIKDDPIFERPFQIESIKENPNYNKISIKNFNDFRNIINNDIEFMRQVGAKNFDLLLMYYEFENKQKHEKQGAIKIKQTNKGAEFVEEKLPEGLLVEDMTPIEKGIGSFDGDFLTMDNGGFLDDDNFGGDNFIMKNVVKALDINDKNNMNGYEGLFDNFNCMCFFTFENVFEIKSKENENTEYYNQFRDNVLKYFVEYRK